MIIKSFEIGKINTSNNNCYLFYGENEGFKSESIKKKFEVNFLNKIHRYDEKEVLENKESFFNNILSKSFFENEKLIIISRATDKITNVIDELIEKNIDDVTIILNANILDKKSKLRSLFEKNNKAVCIPFYADTAQTLSAIVASFFRVKKIPISQQTINLLVERARGDRKNLNNELDKIKSFSENKDKINVSDVLKLTNLAENYDISELVDNCLAKNINKTMNVLNENNFSPEDCVLITRTFLMKAKRLNKLLKELENNNNIEKTVSTFKPTIFWKDKDVVKQQMKNWSQKKIEKLIYKTNEIELSIKKNSSSSVNIVIDFVIGQAGKIKG